MYFKAILTLLEYTVRACKFCRRNKVKCSSRISGQYPCLRCSQRGTNCNPSTLWVRQREYLSLRSSSNFEAQHVQPSLASRSGDSDPIAKSLTGTERRSTNVGDINMMGFRGGSQTHSERSLALDSRDRQVIIGEMSRISFIHPLIHSFCTPILQPLTHPLLQTSE
jgi:hypothetical protein